MVVPWSGRTARPAELSRAARASGGWRRPPSRHETTRRGTVGQQRATQPAGGWQIALANEEFVLERGDRCPGTDSRPAWTNEHGDVLSPERLGPHLGFRFIRCGREPDDARRVCPVLQLLGLAIRERPATLRAGFNPVFEGPVTRRTIPGHRQSLLARIRPPRHEPPLRQV